MMKHIVLWKMKEMPAQEREAALGNLKKGFDALQGVIPGLLRIEFGVDFLRSAHSSDFALYCEFASRAAHDVYQAHPAHLAVASRVREVIVERRVVDYDV